MSSLLPDGEVGGVNNSSSIMTGIDCVTICGIICAAEQVLCQQSKHVLQT